MISWDRNNPVHREIMDCAADAFRAKEMRRLQAQVDAAVRRLPWPVRLLYHAIPIVRVWLPWVRD